MKLINLNTWAGKVKEPLNMFLKNKAADTDIFCFQEIFNNYTGKTDDFINEPDSNQNILGDIKNILVDFDVYFCPVAVDFYGIAMFVRKGIPVIDSGSILIYENTTFDIDDENNDHDRKMQWVKIKTEGKDFIVMNVHGHWEPFSKEDSVGSVEQSKRINSFVESIGDIPKILVGDFNLNPDTESIHLLEKNFMNLITKNNISTTRTSFHKKESKYADYIFVSGNIKVKNFEVLTDVVSDHSPLFVEFE